ncbi:MAG TPA: septal ring lytic transglycosylase RlpA family protein [Stellaceae bacterium]|nr:septal ring lytic transglycosylase RlpA family protein [Stellaceae bacterium]
MRTTIGLSLALAIVSVASWARDGHATHHQPISSVKVKHGRAATAGLHRGRTGRRHAAETRGAARRREHHAHGGTDTRRPRHLARSSRAARLPPQDRYIGPLHAIGPREIGEAAWYGGRHLGERTASGERLDSIHPTAAHRWLPLHSLVRITNLRNGRSAVAVINDRGPVSHSLLIDLSPRTAAELHMMAAGIAPVTVVPVAALGGRPR